MLHSFIFLLRVILYDIISLYIHDNDLLEGDTQERWGRGQRFNQLILPLLKGLGKAARKWESTN